MGQKVKVSCSKCEFKHERTVGRAYELTGECSDTQDNVSLDTDISEGGQQGSSTSCKLYQ